MPKKLRNLLPILLFLCLCTQDAYANTGIPMLAVMWPGYIFLFIPIVLIEACVFKIAMPEISFKNCIKVNFWSNLFSTLIGIPLTWIILLPLQIVSFKLIEALGWEINNFFYLVYAAWMPPPVPDGWWEIHVGILCLLFVFFFSSGWLEGIITKKLFKAENPRRVQKVTWYANLASYALLFAVFIWQLLYYISKH